MNIYIFFGLLLYIASYIFYVSSSRGLGHKAEYLQLRRFVPCAILAVLPMYLSSLSLTESLYIVGCIVGFSWIIVYPLFYYLTYHKVSSDFGFHLDTVFGLYVIGWLTSLKIVVLYYDIFPLISLSIISIIELMLLFLPVCQLFYYYLYKTCIDINAITTVFQTYTNEVLEFFKSLSASICLSGILSFTVVTISIIYGNLNYPNIPHMPTPYIALLFLQLLFLTYYLWTPKKGVFIRTGLVDLILNVRDYLKQTKSYRTNLTKRLNNLSVNLQVPLPRDPVTYILVIGESASRDYIHAFGTCDENTSPWLSKLSQQENCILFPNAYSCHQQTVPVLEKALTEANQYNNKNFYESCSIVDIAKKAGFKVSWFSNQSHVGSADTAVTLVARTSDVSEWTLLHLNQPQYDETLLDYLKQINPKDNNFIVLHLKGSHFNFINRYPQNFAKFSKPDKYDLIPNYLDSIAYTDYFLQQVKEYADNNLNLQALIYFSDHSTIPDKRRSPNFSGFANLRIPLFVYLSESYISTHKDIYDALKTNHEKYWTNDLAYELICGILDVESNCYTSENSLANINYKYTRDMLTSINGQIRIKNDN